MERERESVCECVCVCVCVCKQSIKRHNLYRMFDGVFLFCIQDVIDGKRPALKHFLLELNSF